MRKKFESEKSSQKAKGIKVALQRIQKSQIIKTSCGNKIKWNKCQRPMFKSISGAPTTLSCGKNDHILAIFIFLRQKTPNREIRAFVASTFSRMTLFSPKVGWHLLRASMYCTYVNILHELWEDHSPVICLLLVWCAFLCAVVQHIGVRLIWTC